MQTIILEQRIVKITSATEQRKGSDISNITCFLFLFLTAVARGLLQ